MTPHQIAFKAAEAAIQDREPISTRTLEIIVEAVCDALNPPACPAKDAERYRCELPAGHGGPHEALRGLTSFRQWESVMAQEDEQGRCDVREDERDPRKQTCRKPATMRYHAMGGGCMRLCDAHGEKHAAYCERWNGVEWESTRGHQEEL